MRILPIGRVNRHRRAEVGFLRTQNLCASYAKALDDRPAAAEGA